MDNLGRCMMILGAPIRVKARAGLPACTGRHAGTMPALLQTIARKRAPP
jgi:hypothetical protein